VLIDRVIVGPLETNCWVVSDGAGGPAVVIDPGDDADAIEEALGTRTVSSVILTHGHFDHLGAVRAIVDSSSARLHIHELDASSITTSDGTGGAMFGFDGHVSPPADRILHDGDVVEAGQLSFRVLHTPGHTPGGICLLVQDPQGGGSHLFSGDTLFAGSVGRTDFPGGSSADLIGSLARKLTALPPETVVHPGHGPDTSISRESRVNPFWPRA